MINCSLKLQTFFFLPTQTHFLVHYLTIAELVLRLGLSRSGVNKQIAKLKADGLIEREGSDKSGRWIIVSP